MANLKEIRTRIVSVQSTRQITSAMKMVSAAKFRKAQQSILKMRPYAAKLKEMLSNLSASLDSSEGVYAQVREEKHVMMVVITSNKGLCGAFNTNVIKLTNRIIKEKYAQQKAQGLITIVSIGRKGGDFFTKAGYPVLRYDGVYDRLAFDQVVPIAEEIMQLFANKKIDKVELVYNAFKNAASQELSQEQYLPILPPEQTAVKSSAIDYIFEPNKADIVHEMIPKSLKIQLYKAVIDSYASEHGARMTAMHKATDNATDLINSLKLTYNKARQAAITGEILEIVGGAEALKG